MRLIILFIEGVSQDRAVVRLIDAPETENARLERYISTADLIIRDCRQGCEHAGEQEMRRVVAAPVELAATWPQKVRRY